MIAVIVVCVLVTMFVLVLSLITINKGYAYQHTVDPLPSKNNKENQETNDEEKK
ncbi:YtzI protein [Aquibacillus rhizosphaerae]|uniref:YtzI protein n=1 Tax=Aquibacillus rhizosphaerae TaxID=3051431 RepID=A0ABT7L5K6_9BACI|nr:YtzI protein [Aquibacillus sp. LR5S19]MDL4841141.1 YtzI protein [Aquibacillus sp. LR5S19]